MKKINILILFLASLLSCSSITEDTCEMRIFIARILENPENIVRIVTESKYYDTLQIKKYELGGIVGFNKELIHFVKPLIIKDDTIHSIFTKFRNRPYKFVYEKNYTLIKEYDDFHNPKPKEIKYLKMIIVLFDSTNAALEFHFQEIDDKMIFYYIYPNDRRSMKSKYKIDVEQLPDSVEKNKYYDIRY